MAGIQETLSPFWRNASRGIKLLLMGAAVLLLATIAWSIFIVMHDDYRTLFTQLSDSDAAAIVDGLKRQKVPYKLADGGSTISVPAERVHETRLGLMSSNVALSGGVGFEIFDKQGLGATEQSQRVSFQRALQGELARTIATLENVKQVRVHLVLPESSLFKRDKQDATAAVTLTMKQNATLDSQQIIGIQRLVAASVAGLDPSHVIVTDQRGVTLSAADPAGSSLSGVQARLDLQRQIETHIAQKVGRVLDNAYGPGQAIISVAVALSFDAIKTTTQDLLPVKGSGAAESGVVRKRQSTTGGGDNAGDASGVAPSGRHSGSTVEVEYEYGRRVEEVIAAPGALKRITVGVVVPPQIGEEQQKRIKEFVKTAAGLDESRGDLISIQSLAAIDHVVETSEKAIAQNKGNETDWTSGTSAVEVAGDNWKFSNKMLAIAAGILLVLLLLAAWLGATLRGGVARSLSDDERSRLLDDIRRALGDEGRTNSAPVRHL